jgi:hypothetical protein
MANLDVLPAFCTLEAQVQDHEHGYRVRFRAGRPRRWRRAEKSEWSGWFEWHGEPIVLRWDLFWPPDVKL